MSANNVVWVMEYKEKWHVFYSGCIDNTPTKPDYNDKWYRMYYTRPMALNYAQQVVEEIEKSSEEDGYIGVEYGVCIVPSIEEEVFNKCKPVLDRLAVKEINKKDIEDFVNLVTEMVERLDKKLDTFKNTFTTDRKNGCYQFTYCNECLAYPMGMGCPNIVKGPVELKERKERKWSPSS